MRNKPYRKKGKRKKIVVAGVSSHLSNRRRGRIHGRFSRPPKRHDNAYYGFFSRVVCPARLVFLSPTRRDDKRKTDDEPPLT